MHYLQKHHSIHFSLREVFKFMAEEHLVLNEPVLYF